MKKLLKKILPFTVIFAIIFSLLVIPSSAADPVKLPQPAPSVSPFGGSSNSFHVFLSTDYNESTIYNLLDDEESDYSIGPTIHHYFYLFTLLSRTGYNTYIGYDFILDHTSLTSDLLVSQFTFSTSSSPNPSYIGVGFLWDIDVPTVRQSNITKTFVSLDINSSTFDFTISPNPSSASNFNIPDREYFIIRYPVPCQSTFYHIDYNNMIYYYYHSIVIGSLYASVSSDHSYEDGFTDGYDAGYDDGYYDGHDDGLYDGNILGYNNGYSAGLSDGYQNGLHSSTSYQEGYTAGEYDGHVNANTEDIQSTIDGISDNLNDDNWLEGFTRGMWKGVTDLYNIITNGISINGFLLSSLITTLFALLAVFFVIKIISKG